MGKFALSEMHDFLSKMQNQAFRKEKYTVRSKNNKTAEFSIKFN